MEDRERAEQFVMLEAQERVRENPDLTLSQAVDATLRAAPEMYTEAVGEDAGKLTHEEHAALQVWRGS